MRTGRRHEEVLFLNHLNRYLLKVFNGEKIDIVDEIIDHPDIVFRKQNGDLIGIEVTRLGYESFMKWQTKGTTVDKQRVAHVVVNLGKQLEVVFKKKNPKYKKYKFNRKLSEVWLVLHNDLYEFSRNREDERFNMQWFESESKYYSKIYRCKFDRVLFFEHHTAHIQELYRKGIDVPFYKPAIELPIYNLIESIGTVTKEGFGFDIQKIPIEDEKFFN